MTIAILGAGMVGSAIALDLAKNFPVTAFDISKNRLQQLHEKDSNIQIKIQNLKDFSSYKNFLAPFDLVVTAVPGFMGYETLRNVIGCKKNVVDISFFPEDAMLLNGLAKEKNVTAIIDAGVAPGMSNFIIGRYDCEMKIDDFEIYVGGLPKHPRPPFFYKAPFSPIDVIEEYTRPARLKKNGVISVKPALTDREIIYFEGVGELEAFNTDGLRSLLVTMPHISTQIEKTLRYPGHVDIILALQQSGFFSTDHLSVGGTNITPLAFTSSLLINEWKLGETEEELTVMKVLLHGEGKTIEYNLLDFFDIKTKTSSMARSTGYTCCACVHLIADKLFNKKGIFPPELIGPDKACFDFVINYLAARGVKWTKKI